MKPFNRLIAIVCFAVIATAAPGEETAIHLNITPQPVAAALDALAEQSGLQPFYTDASVQGLKSPGVMGATPCMRRSRSSWRAPGSAINSPVPSRWP